MLDCAREYIAFTKEHFDEFEEHLHQLDLEKEDDVAVAEWEEDEKNRLNELVNDMKDNDDDDWEDEDEKIDLNTLSSQLEKVMSKENVIGVTLPDYLWNGDPVHDLENSIIGIYGEILKRARALNRPVVASIVVNRNILLVDEEIDEDVPQSAVNGDPMTVAEWLHNLVCCT